MTARRASCVVATGLLFAGWSLRPVDAADAPGSPTGASAAMRIYVDPATGKPAPPPPEAEAAPQIAEPQPKAAETPAEEPAPGGGTMIRLPDSFKRPLAATVGPDGAVHVGHGAAGAAADAR
jgi:hypothetical protein